MADLLPLFIFVFLGLFSPGPNVILLTSSGARFGLNATLPHIVGVVIGVGVVGFLVGLGLGAVLGTVPWARTILTAISALWILYLAFTLWRATGSALSSDQRPFTVYEAAMFQWVNPKIWAVSLAAVSYVPDAAPIWIGGTLALAFSSVNSAVCLFWTLFGQRVARVLTTERRWSAFFKTMALLLAGSAVFLVL